MKNRIYLNPNKKIIDLMINRFGPKMTVYVRNNKSVFKVLLDRVPLIRNIQLIYIPSEIEQLLDIMEKLRSDTGCPWDKKQNHESLLPYLLEEANEYCDAVVSKDMNKITEELGDLLLQIVFHCQIAKENNEFNFDRVSQTIKDKLIFRHPHIFLKGAGKENNVTSSQDVEKIWEQQKKKEKANSSSLESLPPIQRIEKNLDILKKQNKLQDLDKNIGKGLLSQNSRKNITQEDYGKYLMELIIYGKLQGFNTTFELLKSIKKWENAVKTCKL